MKILIVDDIEENLYLLEVLLKGSGYEVVTAEDGVEALQKIKKETIGLIISDILMPRMDGFQLCKECKKDDNIKRIPFIFYTATYIDIMDEELALSLGAEKFILKPQEPETFLKILKEVIKEHKKEVLIAPKELMKEDEGIYFEKYNKRLIQKLEKKMLDLEKSEKHVNRLFNVLKTIRNINQLIIRETNRNILLQKTCDILIETRGYNSAWIGFLKDKKTFTIVAGSPLKETVSRFREQVAKGNNPPCVRKALIQKDLFLLINTYKECGDCCLKSRHGEEQSAIIRLEHNHKLLGLLSIKLAIGVYIDKEEEELLKELTGDIAFGLYNLELEEKNQQAEEEIRRNTEDLTLINTLNGAANRGDSLLEILQLLARETKRIFSCHGETVYLLSEDRKYLVLQIFTRPPAMIRRVEKLIGMKIPAISIPVKAGSLYQKALQEGKPQLINDPKAIQGLMAEFTENKILKKLIPKIYSILDNRSVICIPLVSKGKALGLLEVSRKEPFTEVDLRRLSDISGQLTSIIEHKYSEENIKNVKDELEIILDSVPAIIFYRDVEDRYVRTNKALSDALKVSTTDLVGKRTEELFPKAEFENMRKDDQEVILSGKPKRSIIQPYTTPDGIRWQLTDKVPYINKEGKIIGIIGFAKDITMQKKSEEDLLQSYQKLKKTMNATIETISKIVEAKDPYTAGHQQRVSQLSTAIAKELNLSPDKVEGVRISSLIHDIGKIGLPTEILSKSSRLTDIEFSLIKSHSQIGYDILKSIDFSYPVAEIVLQHHEKLNGSGYLRGLKGDKILLEAKIICVADVVEAMSSHRPYRPALGIDKALEEISQNRGILYDPEVVDVCLRLFKEKEFKF